MNLSRSFSFTHHENGGQIFISELPKLLIEVEGGIWSGGRHTRGKGYIGDMEKYNAATMMVIQVLRFSTEQVTSGFAIKQIEGLVKG